MLQRATNITLLVLAFAVSGAPQTLLTQSPDKGLAQVKLQLRTVGDVAQKTDKTQFGPNDDITVQVLATNLGATQYVLVNWKSFIHYQPTLSKAHEIVPYSQAVQKRLDEVNRRAADTGGISKDSAIVVKLPPNQMSEAGFITLSSYYDKLEPGIYELKLQFRERTGAKIESDPIMFEVTSDSTLKSN